MRSEGYSYKEIAKGLSISKSTAFEWTKDITLDIDAKRRLSYRVEEARYRSGFTKHLTKELLLIQIEKEQKEYYKNINNKKKNARLLCALIYFCEGAKDDTSLKFTNSNPELIKLFIVLLRTSFIINEAKFRVRLHLHEYHDELIQKAFWSKITGIPQKQFCKTYLKPHTGKNKRSGYPGCAVIIYHDSRVSRSLIKLANICMKSY